MDDKNLQKLFSKMKTEKLSEVERAHIRNKLLTTIRNSPIPTYSEYSFVRFMWIASTHRVAVGVLSAFVVIFGGVSYASERALPGDALYSLKVGLNEPLRSAFSISNKAKVHLEAELAERRLIEISRLDFQGRLDEGMQERLLTQVAEHMTSLRLHLDESSNYFSEKDASRLTVRLEQSREIRNSLSARVVPAPVLAARADVARSEGGVETTMMAVMASPATEEDSLMMFSSPKVEDTSSSPSEIQLRRVEDEYNKALQILDTRIHTLSNKRNNRAQVGEAEKNQGEVQGVFKKTDVVPAHVESGKIVPFDR